MSTLSGLELAAAGREETPISTTEILLGLLATDSDGSWADVQLKANYVEPEDAHLHHDPEPQADGYWNNVPLTGSATAALQAAVEIAANYNLVPLPPGALALGLLVDPKSGACRALLHRSDCSHEQLLDLVQSDVLGVTLEGLEPSTSTSTKPRQGTQLANRLIRRRSTPTPPASVRSHDWIAEPPGALDVLAEAVDLAAEDSQLEALLSSMLLEPDRVRAILRQVRDLSDVPADEVRASAERRFGISPPDPGALIVAAALSGSERVNAALHRVALTPHELAAQIAEYRLRAAGYSEDRVSDRTVGLSILNGLVGVLTSLLVIRASFGDGGHWWRVFFLLLVWTGHPQLGPAGTAVVAAVMAVLVGPIVGLVHLLGISVDVAHARAEQRTILARTGVRLSLAELRRVIRRFLTSRARRMQSLRQTQHSLRLARREGRANPYS